MLFALILITGGILSFFGPWWIIAPVCMALCWWKAKSSTEGALVAALATLSLWVGYSIFLNFNSEVDMMAKIADLFTGGLGALSELPKAGFVFAIIAVISILIGGLSGAAGVQIRKFVEG
jgi:hypothetical protein